MEGRWGKSEKKSGKPGVRYKHGRAGDRCCCCQNWGRVLKKIHETRNKTAGGAPDGSLPGERGKAKREGCEGKEGVTGKKNVRIRGLR